MRVQVKKYQSVADIAIQYGGDMEAVRGIVVANGLHGMLDVLEAGTIIEVPNRSMNEAMVAYLSGDVVSTLDEGSKGEGIGFWVIEKDFKVS